MLLERVPTFYEVAASAIFHHAVDANNETDVRA